MKILVLDTHVLVWWLEAHPKLPTSIRAELDQTEIDLHLPAIVIAELVDICVKGKTTLKLGPLLEILLADLRYVLHDFTSKMALNTAKHASLSDIHDRCIVATTASLLEMGHDAVLVTRDQSIRESGFVPTLWE